MSDKEVIAMGVWNDEYKMFRTRCPKCGSDSCECFHWCLKCHPIITALPKDLPLDYEKKLGYVTYHGQKFHISEEHLCEFYRECFPCWFNITVPILYEDNFEVSQKSL